LYKFIVLEDENFVAMTCRNQRWW